MFENVIDLSQIFNLTNAIIYLVIINIVAFFAMYIDKKKAKYGKWRISESALFILVLLRWRDWRNCRNVYFSTQNKKAKVCDRISSYFVI